MLVSWNCGFMFLWVWGNSQPLFIQGLPFLHSFLFLFWGLLLDIWCFLTSISYIYLFFSFCCIISWLIFQFNSSVFSYVWYTEFLIFVSGITFIIFFISGSFIFLLIFQIHFFIPDILLLFAYVYGCIFYFFKHFTEFIVWFWQFQYPLLWATTLRETPPLRQSHSTLCQIMSFLRGWFW